MAANGNPVPEQGYSKAVAVTLSDVTTYNPPCDAFMVGVTGHVSLVDMAGVTTVIKNCTQGQVYRIRATKFLAATAATDLVMLFY
jgi:hypothetical protein